MRKLNLLFVILMSISCWATGNNEDLLRQLNDLLRREPTITAQKLERIQQLKVSLKTKELTPKERFLINTKLFDEFATFQFDSALVYVDENLRLSQEMGDAHLLNVTKLNKVHLLSVGGLLVPAEEMLSEVDTTTLEHDERILYFRLGDDLSLYLAEMTAGSVYSDHYNAEGDKWRQHILRQAPHSSFDYVTTRAKVEGFAGHIDEAIRILENYLPTLQAGTRPYGIVTSTLAYYYDLKQNSEKSEECTLLSAISDLKGSIRENSSFRVLALRLYDKGDYEEAFRFLEKSLDDARFYDARLRNAQSARITPTILEAYQAEKNRAHRLLMWITLALAVVVIALIIALVYVVRLIKRVNASKVRIQRVNEELNRTMTQLEVLNQQQQTTLNQLNESNAIKEEYLTRFMQLYSEMIDSSKRYQQQLNKLAMDRKMEDLYKMLKSQSYNDEMTSLFFKNFDSAFLNIYPDFVEKFNALLQPSEQIVLQKPNSLTTELRIYALIRLGINDNQKISEILRSSITTIYTYRSRAKKKALRPKDFEHQVMTGAPVVL